MKVLLAIGLLATASSLPAAQEPPDSDLQDFLAGSYELIARAPESDKTYYGRVELSRTSNGLSVTRVIKGRKIKGSAAVERATADRIRVLRIRFADKGRTFEETCLIGSDLDNYPRFTCQVYEPDNPTQKPGLEALFPVVSLE